MKNRVAFAVVFASLAWTTLPRFVELTTRSIELMPLSREQRRSRVIGPFYDNVARLRSELPPDQPVALMIKRSDDVYPAIFFNYYNYPRQSRIYATLGAYRNDPGRAQIILNVDESRTPAISWMAYPEVRADRLGNEFITPSLEPFLQQGTSFAIPAAASIDGPDPDLYVTEAVLENTTDGENRVRMELLPSKRRFDVVLAPRERRRWNDLVYGAFAVMEQGWLRVESDAPVRGGFWFVNRGRRFSAPLPVIQPSLAASFDVPKDSRFFVINPGEVGLMVRIGEEEFYVGPREQINGAGSGQMRFSSNTPFFAFVSWRDEGGRTVFRWP